MVSGFRRKDGPGALLNPLMVCHEIAWKPGEGHEARRKTYLLGTPLASSPVLSPEHRHLRQIRS